MMVTDKLQRFPFPFVWEGAALPDQHCQGYRPGRADSLANNDVLLRHQLVVLRVTSTQNQALRCRGLAAAIHSPTRSLGLARRTSQNAVKLQRRKTGQPQMAARVCVLLALICCPNVQALLWLPCCLCYICFVFQKSFCFLVVGLRESIICFIMFLKTCF